AAMMGELRLTPGEVKITYGTSAMLDLNAGPDPLWSMQGAYPLVLWRRAGRLTFCLEGTAITAGAAITWLRDGLGVIDTPADSATLAASVPDTGGAWAIPAFQGLGTPYMEAGARAATAGLSRATTRAHVVRAMLHGIAWRCREVYDALRADCSFPPPAALRADGGAARNDLLLQMQADALGLPVERPAVLQAAALGAGYLAGLATGVWATTPDVRAVVVTGSGRFFSAGLDLFEILTYRGTEASEFMARFDDGFTGLFALEKPMVAAVNGHAIAGGAVLAATADFRLAAEGESRIGLTEIQVGVPFPTSALEVVRFSCAGPYLPEPLFH